MATVTGYTAARMKEIEDSTVVGGHIDSFGNLILETRDGQYLLGGHVAGETGAKGDKGDPGVVDQDTLDDLNDRINDANDAISGMGVMAKAPEDLILLQNSAIFLDDGRVLTKVYFMWDVVVSSIDDQPIDVAEYEVWIGTNPDAPTPYGRTPDSEYYMEGLLPGVTQYISVRARAVGSTAWSDLSDQLAIIPVFPEFVDVAPTAPSLASDMGIAYPYWDGEVVEGSLSNGFRHLVTEKSTDEETWETVGIPATQAGVTANIRGTVGEIIFVRFYWVDVLGRVSEPSATSSIEVVGVGKIDIDDEVTDAIDEAKADSAAALASLQDTVVGITVEYAVSDSDTVAPVSDWSTAPPTRTPGSFIWTRTTITYGNESTETSAPALLTGNAGTPGEDGTPGRGMQSTLTTYQVGNSATDAPTGTWLLNPAATNPGQYLWTRTVITWTDLTTSTAYSVAAHGETGPQGPQGSQGIQGPAGADGTPRYTWIKYADTPTTGMSDSPVGKVYMGIAYNKTSATESSVYSDYAWSLIQGPQGPEGEQGPQGSQGIQGPPGENGEPTYTWIKYATSSAGAGISDSPVGKTYIGIAYNKSTIVESNTPGDYTWALIQGPQGEQGPQGIQGPAGADGIQRYTWIKYADTPTTGMSDSPTGKTYMGIAYNKTTATESSNYADYEWSLIRGPAGSDGSPGRGVSSTAVTYQVHSNGTTAPTGTWQSSPQATSPGQYLWTRTITTYTDSTTSTAYSVAAHGATGSTGAAGKGVSSTTVTYQVHSSGTSAPAGSWQSSPQATSPGQYLWTRVVTTYTDSSTSTAYSVAAHGATGAQGIQGPPGENGEPTYTWIKYATSSSGAGISDDPTGKTYIGIAYNKTTATESNTPGDYTWSLIQGPQGPQGSTGAKGDKGDPGNTGKGVSSITPYFLTVGAGTTAPNKPTTNPPGGSWSLTEPGYISSTDLYRTELIVYTDGTFAYTGNGTKAIKVSAFEAATAAVTAANLASAKAAGLVKASTTDPGHNADGSPGRIWIVLNGSGQMIGIKISNGSAWTSYLLLADQILVPSSVGTVSIKDGAVTAAKLIVGDFSNLIPNALLLTDGGSLPVSWARRSGSTGASYLTNTTGLPGTSWKLDGVGTEVSVVSDWFEVKPEKNYRASIRVQNQLTGTSTLAYLRFEWKQKDKTTTSATATSFNIPASSWTTRDYDVTVPADTYYARVLLIHASGSTGGSWWSGNFDFRPMVGTLIEPDSITTPMLRADEIWADQAWLDILRAGVIEVDMLEAGYAGKLDLVASETVSTIIETQETQNDSITALDSSLQSLDTEVSAATQNASTAIANAATAQETADDANEAIGGVREDVKNIKTWFTVDVDGATLGKSDTAFKARITPSRFSIFNGEDEKAWLADSGMHAPILTSQQIVLTNHKIEAYDTGTVVRGLTG